jgi:hypothetical protein
MREGIRKVRSIVLPSMGVEHFTVFQITEFGTLHNCDWYVSESSLINKV